MARSKPRWEAAPPRATSSARRLIPPAALAVLLLVLSLVRWRGASIPRDSPSVSSQPAPPAARPTSPTLTAVSDLFRSRRSNVEVETGGRVVRLLPDDRQGSPHQRFLLRVGGTTVLVAHNLGLAPRIALAPGDSVELRGEYEWNAKGGVIHWTHPDPDGRHEAGYIRLPPR